MGLPSRSFAADAHDCIMVWIRMESTEYKCVARRSAPDGELPSDHHADTTSGIRRRISKKGPVSPFILPSRAQASRRCETQASAKAACRQAALAFRSLDAFRALQEPDRRRRDEERPSRSEQRTISKPKEEAVDRLTGQPPGKATVTIDNRRSAFSDNPLPRPPAVQLR